LISQTSIKIAKYIYFNIYEAAHIHTKTIIEKLQLPLFVKPASLGSSIGVTKVKKVNELRDAVEYAFQFDKK